MKKAGVEPAFFVRSSLCQATARTGCKRDGWAA
jgi:hypothetical protein